MHARQLFVSIMFFFKHPPFSQGILQILKASCKESQNTGLGQKKWFGPTFLYSLLRLVKGTAKPNTCQRTVQ